MLTALFFLMTFATVATLIWAGTQLFQEQDDPLADRLQELQSSAMVSTAVTRMTSRVMVIGRAGS